MHFQYDVTNQLKRVSYNGAIPPPSPTPVPTPSPTGTPTPPPPPSPTATPQQVESVLIEDDGNAGNGEVVDVTMTTNTAGATILYTIGNTQFINPTHDGNGGPTGNTMVYSGSPLHVGTEQHLYFRALAYKAGMADSAMDSWDVDNHEVEGGVAPMPGQRVVTYKYTPDKLNRHSVSDTATGQTTSYASSLLNQYSTVGGIGYTYDTKFNLTSAEGFSGTYDAANRLVSASNSGMAAAPEVELVYDGLGRCVKRTIQGVATIIIYDDWKPIAEWDGWTEEYFQAWNVYGPGADEILLRHDAKMGYVRYHSDANGNVAFLLDNDGTVVEKYTYDVFGRPKILVPGPEGEVRTFSYYGNRFLFQGREYIGEVGVYDYRNRFYHPGLGRFLQKDPTGFDAGDMNLFRYCGDDPIDGSDPTGLDKDDPQPVSRPLHNLTSFGQGDWISGANGLSYADKQRHFSAGVVMMGCVFQQAEGEKKGGGLMPLPKDLLARMYATNLQNAQQASDTNNWTHIQGTSKMRPEEYSTTIYRKGDRLEQIGPKKGFHRDGAPYSEIYGRELKGGGTRVAGTHIHVTGNGRHQSVDIDRARGDRFISGVGHVSSPHILNIYVPPASGRGPGAFYHTNDGVKLNPGEF